MEEDDLPRPRKRWIDPIPLDPVSVADLNDYIDALKTEIHRADAAIRQKQSHRSAAEGFFKK